MSRVYGEPAFKQWAREEDSSLGRAGVECVSPPFPYEQARRAWEKACLILQNVNAETDYRCGAHIHVSRDCVPMSAHFAIEAFLYSNRELAEEVFGRKAGEYCKWDTNRHNRYRVINFGPSHTVEYRLGAGTTDSDKLLMRLDFLETLYRVAESQTTVDFAGSVTTPITLSQVYQRAKADGHENLAETIVKHFNYRDLFGIPSPPHAFAPERDEGPVDGPASVPSNQLRLVFVGEQGSLPL